MRTAEEIVELYHTRQRLSSPTIEAMTEIRDIVNGDVLIPLPEMDANEKPAVANLVAEGIDQLAMRIASTMPHLMMPALDPRKETGRHSIEYSEIRRKAVLSWWELSRLKRLQRRRARFSVGYGIAPVHIKPDFKHGVPRWELRHPLTTYPDPSENYDDLCPRDVVFAYRKSHGWLRMCYPEKLRQVTDRDDISASTMYTLLEYTDAEETVLVLVGNVNDYHPTQVYSDMAGQATRCVELERVPNRAGRCTVITPKRITLDRLVGQFNQVVGLYEAEAALTALDLIATRKSVFPDMVMIGQDGRTPQLLGERWKDGSTGEINEVQDGDVRLIQLTPGFKTGEAIDRLERSIRIHGVAPQFGGENPTNIRTGRAAEVGMSAQIDFRIQEYQETAAESLQMENEAAIAVAKGWFGDKPKSFYVNWKGAKGPVDYVPNKHFETDLNVVAYPMPGADINGLLLGIGNRIGVGLMSAQKGRELDPLIEDADEERDRVMSERIETALLDSISQMAATGMIPPADIAAIQRKVFNENKPLAQAVEEVQKEAQERQAQQVEAQAPEAQPGIAVPGTGAEAGLAIPETEPGLERLTSLLYNMRQPSSPAGGAPPAVPAGAVG